MKYNLIETAMGVVVIGIALTFLIFGVNTNMYIYHKIMVDDQGCLF